MRNIFAVIGFLGIAFAFVVWQGGFCHKQINDAIVKVNRARAAGCAAREISRAEKKVDAYDEKARELRIVSYTKAIEADGEKEDLAKLDYAIKQLVKSLQKEGYPKPSEAEKLGKKLKKKFVFAGREGTVEDAYRQLSVWEREFNQKKRALDAKLEQINRLNVAADQLIRMQKDNHLTIERLKNDLKNLEIEREIVAQEAEAEELAAAVQGVNVGAVGKHFATMKAEINEGIARKAVLEAEAGKGEVFSLSDISSDSNDANSDYRWDGE